MTGSKSSSSLTEKREKVNDDATTTGTPTRTPNNTINSNSFADNKHKRRHSPSPPTKKIRVSESSNSTSKSTIREVRSAAIPKTASTLTGQKRQSNDNSADNIRPKNAFTTNTPTQQQKRRRIRQKVVISPILDSATTTTIKKEPANVVADPVVSSSPSSSIRKKTKHDASKARRVTEQFDIDECRSATLDSTATSPSSSSLSSHPKQQQRRLANAKTEKINIIKKKAKNQYYDNYDSNNTRENVKSAGNNKDGRKIVVKQEKVVSTPFQKEQAVPVAVVATPAKRQQEDLIKRSILSSRESDTPKKNKPSTVMTGRSTITAISTRPTTKSVSSCPDARKPIYPQQHEPNLNNKDVSSGSGRIRNVIVHFIWIIGYILLISIFGTLGTHIVMMNRYGSKWIITIPQKQQEQYYLIEQQTNQKQKYPIQWMETKLEELELEWANEELNYISDLQKAEQTIASTKQRIQSLQNELHNEQHIHAKTIQSMEHALKQRTIDWTIQESAHLSKLQDTEEQILSLQQRFNKDKEEHMILLTSLRGELHQQKEEHTDTLTLVQTLRQEIEVLEKELQERKVTYENELHLANQALEDLKQHVADEEEHILKESKAIRSLQDKLNEETQHKMKAVDDIETLRQQLYHQEEMHSKSLQDIQQLQKQIEKEQQMKNKQSRELQSVKGNIVHLQGELSKQRQIVMDTTSSMQHIQQTLQAVQHLYHRQKVISSLKKYQVHRLTNELHRQQDIAIETVNFVTTMAIQEQQDAAADAINFIAQTVSTEHKRELERQKEIAIETINFVATTAVHEQKQQVRQDEDGVGDDVPTEFENLDTSTTTIQPTAATLRDETATITGSDHCFNEEHVLEYEEEIDSMNVYQNEHQSLR